MINIVKNGICREIIHLSNGVMCCSSWGTVGMCKPFAQAWAGIDGFFFCKQFLQCVQIYLRVSLAVVSICE